MSEGKIGQILGLISVKKQLILLPAALIIGVILLIIGGRGDASAVSGKVSEENISTTSECERRLEEKVRLICEKVSGVSDVSAMVTVETVSENIYAENIQTKISENSQETRKEFAGSSESPIRIGERGARVRGRVQRRRRSIDQTRADRDAVRGFWNTDKFCQRYRGWLME